MRYLKQNKKFLIVYICVFSIILMAVILFIFAPKMSLGQKYNGTSEVSGFTEIVEHNVEGIPVEFYTEKGALISRTGVDSGNYIIPPAYIPGSGLILTGWEGASLFEVTEVSKYRAVCEDVHNKRNVFALPSSVAPIGEELKIDLVLCGQVNLCGFDIILEYNSSLLSFVELRECDEDIILNCDSEKGRIYMNFINTENILGEIDFGSLVFLPITEQSTETKLTISPVKVVCFEGEDIVEIGCNTVSGDLYIMEPSKNVEINK